MSIYKLYYVLNMVRMRTLLKNCTHCIHECRSNKLIKAKC